MWIHAILKMKKSEKFKRRVLLLGKRHKMRNILVINTEAFKFFIGRNLSLHILMFKFFIVNKEPNIVLNKT